MKLSRKAADDDYRAKLAAHKDMHADVVAHSGVVDEEDLQSAVKEEEHRDDRGEGSGSDQDGGGAAAGDPPSTPSTPVPSLRLPPAEGGGGEVVRKMWDEGTVLLLRLRRDRGDLMGAPAQRDHRGLGRRAKPSSKGCAFSAAVLRRRLLRR